MKTAQTLLAALGTLLTTLVLIVPAQAQQDRYEQLAHDLHTPGLAMVEFDANGITGEHYVGVDGNNNPITADSLFIWGSVSKSFTSALALELADKGLIDLNAPVTQYYPEFRNTAFGNNGATITDLIHHTSGLPRELSIYPRELPKVIEAVKELKNVNPTGSHSYSNIGYILLQHAMERATGQSYSELLTHYLNPATGISPISTSKEATEKNVPEGYVPFYMGNRTVSDPVRDDEAGEGYLAGTGRQLATYGAWQLRQHQQGQLPSTFSTVPTGEGSSEYGAGLEYAKATSSIDGSEVTIVAHTGNIWGYTTYLGFNQTTGKGLAVLLNTYGLRDHENTNIANKLEKFTGEALGIEAPANLPTNVPKGDIIIWTQVALILILLIAIAFTLRTWVRRPAPSRTQRRTIITIASALILGLGTTAAIMIGVPAAIGGMTWKVLLISTPDLTLNFWALAAETAILALIITARQLAWRRKTAAASG
ncbi:serine hydrolase domain-containing protein [Corynebacterium durum]|uniref:serine hydrolase domain-containing protein n=1 Tax=Corynebacterium durum TaxID=61592 RepID=UPI0028E648F2|nr:serine hydrolase domain-containing protein [Corynebacterium durum]